MAFSSDSTVKLRLSLSRAIADQSTAFERLSTGRRINKAKDDAAGLAAAASLDAVIKQLSQASRNVFDVVSALSITDSSLEQVSNINGRLQELAVQSSNGTLSDTDREALQTEFGQLTQELGRIAETTSFNGQALLNGTSIDAQVGTGSGANDKISTSGVDVGSLVSSLSSQNISTQGAATTAIDAVQQFAAQITTARGTIGASQSRLDSASSSIESSGLGAAEASSRITDADIADELSRKTAADIRAQATTSILAQVAQLDKNRVKSLLG